MKLKTNIINDSAASPLIFSPSVYEYDSTTSPTCMQNVVTVPASTSAGVVAIPSGTIKTMILTTAPGVDFITVSVSIGGNSQTLNVNEFTLINGNVTALTVTSASTTVDVYLTVTTIVGAS